MKKKNKIEFSCLMSVYYKENPDYLKQAIDSIINQTLLPNEFVIVEDGKLTDDLENVLKKYENEYSWIRVIRYEENRGLGVALHDGVLECKYPYIARMDSDDISVPDRFEKQIQYLEEHPKCDMVGSNIAEHNESMNQLISYRVVPQKDEDIKKMMKKRNPFNHMSVIYKKERAIEAGNYQEMLYFEDYYLWARMQANNCTFYNLQEYLINARCGEEMIKRRGGIKYIKPIIRFEKHLKKLKIINIKRFIFNVLCRIFVSILPKSTRYYLYKIKLRKGV